MNSQPPAVIIPPTGKPPSRRARALVTWACAIAWVGAFAASHVPAERMPPLGVSDTKLHFTGFAVLTVLFWSALASRGYGRAWRAVLVLGIVSLYGGFDELTQPLVNRTAAWGDWYGDVAGTAAAWLCLEVIAAIRVMHHRASRERKRAGLLPSDLPSVVHRTKDGRG